MERQCGDCQLCCRLLAVRAIGKKAGERCVHQKFKKGCSVYDTTKMPSECKIWNCRWLTSDDTADLGRPDHSHFVVDIMPDFITAQDNETGARVDIPVIQVWVDPKYPDAHRDPALRAYLDRRGREGNAALIRYSATRAFTIFPPSMSPDGQWHEIDGESSGRDHSAREIIETLEKL